MKQSNALFIVIEGLDGAGTTTQTELLAKKLRQRGEKVHITFEPSNRELGKLARRYLSGELKSIPNLMALLFAADRIDHVEHEIIPKLESGTHVITDRYFHSSFVYQGEDINGAYDTKWVEILNSRAKIPDITFFIRVPVEVSLVRIGGRESKDIYETEASLRVMESRYTHVMKRLKSRGDKIVEIDGTQSILKIEEELFSSVKAML